MCPLVPALALGYRADKGLANSHADNPMLSFKLFARIGLDGSSVHVGQLLNETFILSYRHTHKSCGSIGFKDCLVRDWGAGISFLLAFKSSVPGIRISQLALKLRALSSSLGATSSTTVQCVLGVL